MKITKKILQFLDPSLKIPAFFLIILLILNALAESLSIALIIPITLFLFDNNLIDIYPKFFSFIESFSPFTYLAEAYSKKIIIISGLLVIFCFLIILRIIFNILFLYYRADLQLKTRYLISDKLMNGYFNIPGDKFFNKNNSSLAFSAINETAQVSTCVGLLFVLVSEFFLLLCVFTILVVYQTKITILISIIIGISSYIFLIFFKKKINLFAVTRREGEEENLKQVYEMFDGLVEIKSYNSISYFLKKYFINFKSYLKNLKFAEVLPGLPKLWLEFISLLTITLLLAHMINNNFTQAMIISTLGLYIGAVFRLMPSVNKIINAIQSIKYFEPIIDNLLIDFNSINKNDFFIKQKVKKIKMNSKITLSNISYGYNESKLILDNLSLSINKNQKIGISGQSGCGKSTLIKILAGLIKPNRAQFTIDDSIEIKDDYLNLKGISFVPQNIFIVNDSIRKNIAFGISDKEIDEEKINHCIKQVQLHKMLNSLSEVANHHLLERGKNLSGGQIQRIGIARALYFDPDIIIFDESTSSLDRTNEEKILKLIEKISDNKTIIFISHRKEVLNFCDINYHMENKKIYVQ
jgi:ABC-type bacteriocin/lantibiotic exporter with double-glycine peptidase domain